MKKFISILVFLSVSGAVLAEETAEQMLVQMSGKISDEYSSCAAYFEIAYNVMKKENRTHAKGYENLKNESLAYAIGMAEMNQEKGSAKERVTKNYKASITELAAAKDMGREEFAKLFKDKSVYCPRLMKDPTVAMEKI